jgi:multiple sugar transport system substrate-binding protein
MHQFRPKAIVAIAALGLVAAWVGVTSNGSTASAASSAKISGTVVLAEPSDNPGDLALRRHLASSFMKLHPGVQVKVLLIPATNYDAKVETMIAGGTPPDIFNSGEVQIPNIIDKHFALDLTPLAKRDHYDLSAFYPQVIKGLTFHGQLSGLTDNWDTEVMYYNASLFKQAGVAPPTDKWTWTDFMRAAGRLTSGKGPTKTYGAAFDNWWAPVFDQVWAWGGDPFPNNGQKAGFASKKAIAGVQSIVDLYKSGDALTPTQMTNQGAEEAFLGGRVGMLIGEGRWAAYDLRDVKKFLWKVTPLPKGPAGRANFFHLSLYAIARTSRNSDAAWEFLKYMVSPAGIRLGLSEMQGIPSRTALAASNTFSKAPFVAKHDAYKPFIESLPTVRSVGDVPNFDQIRDQFYAALDPVWSFKKTPKQVLPPLAAKIDKELKAGSTPGGG